MLSESKIKSRIPWAVKMNRPAAPRIITTPPTWQAQYGQGKMLIATPRLVEALVNQVCRGQITTVRTLRDHLAEKFGVAATCPLTTGIFLRIIAENEEELRAQGSAQIAPYWRVVKDDGSLYDKFPGGIAAQAERLAAEGVSIIPVRHKPRVDGLDRYLAKEFR